jgi:hypothetical protein
MNILALASFPVAQPQTPKILVSPSYWSALVAMRNSVAKQVAYSNLPLLSIHRICISGNALKPSITLYELLGE